MEQQEKEFYTKSANDLVRLSERYRFLVENSDEIQMDACIMAGNIAILAGGLSYIGQIHLADIQPQDRAANDAPTQN